MQLITAISLKQPVNFYIARNYCLIVPTVPISYTWFAGFVQPSFWNSHIPRKKRSVLEQSILSPVERLHRQLHYILQQSEFSNLSSEQDGELICQKSHLSSGEIGLGCVLLKSIASSREGDEESQSYRVHQ